MPEPYYARRVQVFLVRHAEAIPETVAVRDPHRSLSVVGRTQARALGDRMRWHDCAPTHVWTSPLVRAVQTAELLRLVSPIRKVPVAQGMHCELPIDSVPALAPDGAPRDVVAAIKALPETAAVVLVGHEPALSAIGALLVGDPAFASLAKAEAVRIYDGQVRWRFAWDADEPKR
jgi:phosphohistidine phosphatase